MRLKKLLLTLMGIAIIPLAIRAQETTSDMQGKISDGTNGLAGATVIALHTPTGTKYSTTTRSDGRFNIPGMRVGGPYTITVTYAGYREEKQENINLTLGQTFYADFTLQTEAKQLTEVVLTGTHQNKIFNTSHTGAQAIITRNQLEELPTTNRSMQDFTKLEPTSNGLSFAGSNSGENNVTVDGADFNNSFGLSSTLGGQANAQPIALDAIDQIQVNVSPFDVRQGGFVGAGINSVTRSGTNKLRVTVYDYTRGPGTQGYKVDDNVVTKTPFSFNVLGGSIGGPIIPNKLFFFVNAEEDLQSAPATAYVASTASNPPKAGAVSLANADTLNALAQYLEKTYNYNPGSYQGYPFKTNSYKANVRIDWNINQNNVLSLKYNYLKSYTDQFPSTSRAVGASGLVGGQSPGNLALPFFSAGYRINNNLGIWILELNSRFSNKASNKFQIGYTRERDFRSAQSPSSDFPLVDILDGGNVYTTFGYEPFTYHNQLYMDSYQLTDIYSLFKGSHEITLGTQNSYKKYQNAFAPGYNGVYQFTSLDAFYSGQPAASYAQSYSTLPGAAFPFAYAGATNLSLFAQDKWRAGTYFTLVYGVRLDYTTYENKFTDNPAFDQLPFAGGATYNVGKAPSSFLVVSPRAGFNWDVSHNRSFQIRGGAGVFEGAPPFVWVENQAANNGVQFGSFTEKNVPFFPTAQQGLNYYLQNSGQTQTSTPTGYSVNVSSSSLKYPTKLRTDLAFDWKFFDDFVFTGEFIYSKDLQATYVYNANLNETNGFAITNGGDTRERYLTSVATSNKYYFGTTLQDPNLGNAIILGNSHKGYSYSAVATIAKNIAHFNFSVSYAYNNTETVMETGSTASTLWSTRAVGNSDPNAPTLAHPQWYQPHRVIAFANYHFEYGKHFATNFGAVFEATSNGTTSYVYNGDLNGDGNTGNDLIYIPKSATDINLIDAGSYNKTTMTGVTTGTAADPRTAAQIWTQLNDFINQDHYMYHHRGEYAQASSVIEPWFKHLDLHLGEDIFFYAGKTKHTLSLSLDLLNVGNFLDRNWGIARTPASSNFLKFEGMAADGKTPLFSFPYADATNQVPYTQSFTPSTSTFSRWLMQFGFRYTFN